MEAARGSSEAWEDRLDDQEDWRATVVDREHLNDGADHSRYTMEALITEGTLRNRELIQRTIT
jgi:hypothetical protein